MNCNPVVLRTSKAFGSSECNRIKEDFFVTYCVVMWDFSEEMIDIVCCASHISGDQAPRL